MPPEQSAPDQTSTSPGNDAETSGYKIDRRKAGWNTRCTICSHPNRAQIELAMARGASRRTVAKQYNCSDDAAYRHFADHVPDKVKAALLAKYLRPSATIEAILAEETPGLLERLAVYRAGLQHLFNLAVENGDAHAASSVTAQLRSLEELIARQTGELRAMSKEPIKHLHLTADFANLQKAIVTALRPYPDALAAVSQALRASEISIDAQPVLIEGAIA